MWRHIGMEKEKKKNLVAMQLFVLHEDKQYNTDNRQNLALYNRIEKKGIFSLSCKPKCIEARVEGRKCRCYKIISAQIKRTKTRIIMIVKWRE